MKKDIRAYTYEQLAAEMEQIGEKKFRAKQIYEWLHVKLADSFEEMTNCLLYTSDAADEL